MFLLFFFFTHLFCLLITGTFPWPWEKKGKKSVLDEYGLGLVFYFKLLRSLAILFAIMSAITIPSMGIFISAKVKTAYETHYEVVTHSERMLGSKVRAYVTVFLGIRD